MDTELDPGEQVSADMRQEIDGTRSAMADKLEALQDRVMNTVQSAQETVEDSIQSANDTMASVKQNLDIKYQVEQHPWLMVGGSILAGVALGSLFQGLRRRTRQAPPSSPHGDEAAWRPGSASFSIQQRGNGSETAPRVVPNPPRARPGVFHRFRTRLTRSGDGHQLYHRTGGDSIKETMHSGNISDQGCRKTVWLQELQEAEPVHEPGS